MTSNATPIGAAAAAKTTPPTQAELSNPAATMIASNGTNAQPYRDGSRVMVSTAMTTQPAAAKCCGTQLAWKIQLRGQR